MFKIVTTGWFSLLILFSMMFQLNEVRYAYADGSVSLPKLATAPGIPLPDWAMRPVVVTVEDETNAQRFHSEGNDFYAQKEYEKSIAFLTRSVQLNPNESRVWFDLAMALSKRVEYQKAEDALMQAITLDPDFKEAYKRISLVLCLQGKCASGGGAGPR